MTDVAATAGVIVLLLLVISIGGGLLLYWAVQRERDWGAAMARADAERAARSDVDDSREGGR